MLVPWSAKVGPKIIFKPFYHRKNDFSRNIGRRSVWSVSRAPSEHPKRPKIASRRVQDRLGSVFLTLEFSFCVCIVFGSVLVPIWPPKWSPGGAQIAVVRPLEGVQDGLGINLARFSCRLVARGRFVGRLGVVLGSFLGAPWVVLVLFRHFNSSIQPINSSTHRFNISTHQLIDSTHQPINPSVLYRRSMSSVQPGPADCALRD